MSSPGSTNVDPGIMQRSQSYTSTDRYFGINASYPKPKKHWNYATPKDVRLAKAPVQIDCPGGKHISNELHPPFSRVHYLNGRLEDSGYQGQWNILRYGGYQLGSYDRSFRPEACKSKPITLEEYQTERRKLRNVISETSFDRTMIHSSCLPNTVELRKHTPLSLQEPPLVRVNTNPVVKCSAGLVGPEYPNDVKTPLGYDD